MRACQTYNPAGQIASVARSNDTYAWTAHYNVNRLYASNGLNQLTQSGSVTPTYDARGNLTSAGSTSYGYDGLNMLVSASSGTSLGYDPLRLSISECFSLSRRREKGRDEYEIPDCGCFIIASDSPGFEPVRCGELIRCPGTLDQN